MPLYRGGFKNGSYDGHGTLYWVGTEITEYSGQVRPPPGGVSSSANGPTDTALTQTVAKA